VTTGNPDRADLPSSGIAAARPCWLVRRLLGD
jgi:hypothetical protein